MLLAKNQFLLDDDIIFLNHGSFGATPKVILEHQNKYRYLMENSPVDFFINKAPELLENSINKLAKFVNSKPENLFFVDNATTGINTILKSLLDFYTDSVEIVFFDSIYPAIRSTLLHYEKTKKIILNEIHLTYPTTKSDIIDNFTSKISRCTKIAIFDHISSPTAIVFPVEDLIEICSSMNITTIVDGAHSVGQLDLDFSKIEYDFYVSNCHKWLFAPKGSAFLWINDLYIDLIHPLTISLFYEQGLKKEFYWQGTKDITNWLTVADCIDFFEDLGKNRILQHNKNLNQEAKIIISEHFGLDKCPDDLNMAMTTFYFDEYNKFWGLTGNDIRNKFFNKFKIEIPFFIYNNKIYYRISSQIYNSIEDYYKLIEAIDLFKKNKD